MPLKALISKDDYGKLSKDLQELYSEDGDNFVFSGVDDTDFKAKLGEFRNNNIALEKAQRDLQTQLEGLKPLMAFKDMDIEKVNAALKTAQDAEEKKLIDAGEIDKVVEQRVELVVKQANDKYTALEQAHNELMNQHGTVQGQLKGLLIDKHITQAVSGVGTVKKGALDDVLSRANSVWNLDENGTLVAKRGDTALYGSDGKSALTPEEWAQSLVSDAPFLFEKSSGAGGAGGDHKHQHGAKVIDPNDKTAFGDNLEDIASGKVKVAAV